MTLQRKIAAYLENWKATEGHKPLILKGCRQCGKTFSVRAFGEAQYKNVVYTPPQSNCWRMLLHRNEICETGKFIIRALGWMFSTKMQFRFLCIAQKSEKDSAAFRFLLCLDFPSAA